MAAFKIDYWEDWLGECDYKLIINLNIKYCLNVEKLCSKGRRNVRRIPQGNNRTLFYYQDEITYCYRT